MIAEISRLRSISQMQIDCVNTIFSQRAEKHMNKNEYDLLRNGAAFEIRTTSGVLALTDNDRVDFLQRMTTNDIAALKPDESTVTVLPSPTARVLFAFTVVAQEETLLCLPAPGQTEALSKHLRSQIFFMDKVKVADLSEAQVRIRLMGPQANAVLNEMGVANVDSADDGAVLKHDMCLAVKQVRHEIPGFELIVPVDAQAALIEKLNDAGAAQVSDEAALTARRIELGRPAVAHELVDTYSPLESGLAWTCAENKGCYTGQEIIARQITYDKVTKTLVGLTSEAPFNESDDVLVDGRSAGQVTSVGHSPALDKFVGLAVLKRPHNEAGTQVIIGEASSEVQQLPMTA